MNFTRVRIRESGQVIDMVPDVARAMILGGTAVEVKSSQPESMAVSTATAERAVTPAQDGPVRKPSFSRKH
jgi:hypothetical protein